MKVGGGGRASRWGWSWGDKVLGSVMILAFVVLQDKFSSEHQ